MCGAMLVLLSSMIEEDQGWLCNAPLNIEYNNYRTENTDYQHINMSIVRSDNHDVRIYV